MGLLESIFGKKKAHNNTFNNPELQQNNERGSRQTVSILFKDEHEPPWISQGKGVPDPYPEPLYLGEIPPELPLSVRQKVGRALEGRFQMSPDSHRLITLLNDPNADPGSITQAVTKDPSLATRILKTVNSAQFGLATQITAVGRAVVLLGFNNIRSLALAHAVNLRTGNPEDASRMRMLWMNAAVTSACAASLAKKSGNNVDLGDAATAGLLLNIGKMLLRVEETGVLSTQTGLPPSVVEGYAGSCFAETWGLPDLTGKILEASSLPFFYPIESIPASHRKLALTVAFASFVTRWYGFPNGDSPIMPSQDFLATIGWKAAKNGHWIDNESAMEIEKARTAMQVYLG